MQGNPRIPRRQKDSTLTKVDHYHIERSMGNPQKVDETMILIDESEDV